MGKLSQFGLLLWKNWILQSRKKCVTVFEIVLPVVFAAIVIAVRSGTRVVVVSNSTFYQPENISDLMVPRGLRNSTTSEILYTPDNSVIRTLMINAIGKLKSNSSDFVGKAFKSEEEMIQYFTILESPSQVFMGVVFEGDFDPTTSFPGQLTLKLRPYNVQSSQWNTDREFAYATQTSPQNGPDYYKSGFVSLQYAITAAIIEHQNALVNVTDDVMISLEKMVYPPYYQDFFKAAFQIVGPLMTAMAMILSCLQMTKDIVYEKERKLKESMKMMGLSNFVHWAAWFFKCFVSMTIIMAIITGFFSIPLTADGRSIIGNSDVSLFFVFMLCYAIAIVSYCFMISTFFNNANGAAAVSAIVFVIFYGPYFAIHDQYQFLSTSQKLASSLLFNTGLGIGYTIFSDADASGKGLHWYDFHEPATAGDNVSLLLIMVMLLVDSGIHFLVTWYVDAVFPGEYGVPQPWYFPVTLTYWCGSRPRRAEVDVEWNNCIGFSDQGYFEKEPEGLPQGISIRNLRKEFKSRGKSPKVAVNGTNLNVYKGQITALLGHNGAGKTTTMSMLTGFLPATSGTALVNGYDINKDITSIRKTLGLCPQHDILFDTLTVREHLFFFAKLKGCPRSEVDREVSEMIKVVGLAGKDNALSSTLSGGQKRKLSIGIALIGGSETVILDEPTSGMDPQARRQIWSILQEHKASRTILFTTHFMDEADVLGDRIAIMAEGVVKCCGTPLFLKKKYGSGYELTIVKGNGCNIRGITEVIKNHVTSAMQKSDVGAELTYTLPSSESPKFENLFKDLEINSSALGISSFGASVTTMEEVFLRAGESADSEDSGDFKVNSSGLSSSMSTTEMLNGSSHRSNEFLALNQDDKKNTGVALTIQQFRAALTKKILYSWRNPIVTLAQLILPVVFTILGIVVSTTIGQQNAPEPPLELSMSPFQENIVAYSYEGVSSGGNLGDIFLSELAGTASKEEKVELREYGGDMSNFYEKVGLDVGIYKYNKEYLIGASFENNGTNRTLDLKGFYNTQPYHTEGIAMTYLMNTLLKYYVSPDANITVTNHPLPDVSKQNQLAASPSGFNLAFFIELGMAFMASSFVIFLIGERISQAKHIQTVSGLRPITFWLTHFIWDFVSYLLPCAGVLIVFAAFQTEAFVGADRLGYILVILLAFGWAVLPFTYAFSFRFNTPPGGMVAMVMLNFLSGFVFLMVVFIVTLNNADPKVTDAMRWVFGALFPTYCLGQSFMDFYDNFGFLKTCTELGYDIVCRGNGTLPPCCSGQEDYFSLTTPAVGRFALMMGAQGAFYFTLVLLIEYGVFRRIRYLLRSNPEYPPDIRRVPEDEDVAAERNRINSIHPKQQTDSLILHNFAKFYGSHLAVNRLCLGVPQNECFGLLGVNGAGKTSTFKMLTGGEDVSDGNGYINGYGVRQSMQRVHRSIGYCPQFDALIDQMTGRETLTMYARLRGIPEPRIPEVVGLLMKTLWFAEHADKETRHYSGGTKRKLSTAIALIGDSPVIFLDEPTTGVDPVARRQLWNLLSQIRASGRTLILTSHSMEECDALCTRLAIMVNGEFLCLGSPQHLKNKFGQGYTFIARVALSNTEALESFIEEKFPRHHKMDSSSGYVSYQLTDPDIPLSYIFGTVEKVRQQLHLEDYSVSQTTLHQVFLDFTRHQITADTNVKKTKRCCCCSCCCCCN